MGDNDIAALPRNVAGGPARLKAQLKALANDTSSGGTPRNFTGWGDGEWDGLRVFDGSNNRLGKIPSDFAATLLAGGRTPWKVSVRNNPMNTAIRAVLGAPGEEDTTALLRYLDALNDELELMDREESELGERARRVRNNHLSAECHARIERPELGVMDRSDRFDRPRHRRFSVSEDGPRVLKRVETANPGALLRVKPIDEQYQLRCEARKAAAAARARTRWGAAIFSKMKGTDDVKEAAAKLQSRHQLLDAIKRATDEKARRDEEEFRWIHDVELLRHIPFRLRCQLARSCRKIVCTRGERVYAEGDDGDVAYIVLEGRCQLRVNGEFIFNSRMGNSIDVVFYLQYLKTRTRSTPATSPRRISSRLNRRARSSPGPCALRMRSGTSLNVTAGGIRAMRSGRVYRGGGTGGRRAWGWRLCSRAPRGRTASSPSPNTPRSWRSRGVSSPSASRLTTRAARRNTRSR